MSKFIAHRGGTEETPYEDNTLEAYQNAYEKGIVKMEGDIYQTGNDFVLNHDGIEEVTENNNLVDVLQWMDGRGITFYIELKNKITNYEVLRSILNAYKINIVVQISHKYNYANFKDYNQILLPYNDYENVSLEDYCNIEEDKLALSFEYYKLSSSDINYISNNVNKIYYWTIKVQDYTKLENTKCEGYMGNRIITDGSEYLYNGASYLNEGQTINLIFPPGKTIQDIEKVALIFSDYNKGEGANNYDFYEYEISTFGSLPKEAKYNRHIVTVASYDTKFINKTFQFTEDGKLLGRTKPDVPENYDGVCRYVIATFK